ncbi:hypothetical protein [Borrelia sp. RT1S]|uniref:hypothetical protein n=1 Tax=Borrelia sp. RT1S TaxID=2898580 RepID=UPI001E3D0C6A|nr:hypothetical protein [Borrelia sp. RT1S]UGQ17970.1 hypothetical protein LSO05_05920 [Borrelia sp. RT1S]
MKKINIIFPLILVATLVSCKLGGFGIGVVTSKGKVDVANQAATADEAEKEAILKELKTKRDGYKKEIADLKAKFEKEASRNEVTIPEVLKKELEKYKDQIHASLGYDNETHKNLNEAIKALKLDTTTNGNKKEEELKIVYYVLGMLITLDEATTRILDKMLSDEMLEKIKNDKDALEGSVAELGKFIGSRDAFIRITQKAAKAAATAAAGAAENKADLTKVKAELNKIIAAATSSTSPSETE